MGGGWPYIRIYNASYIYIYGDRVPSPYRATLRAPTKCRAVYATTPRRAYSYVRAFWVDRRYAAFRVSAWPRGCVVGQCRIALLKGWEPSPASSASPSGAFDGARCSMKEQANVSVVSPPSSMPSAPSCFFSLLFLFFLGPLSRWVRPLHYGLKIRRIR